MKSYLCLFFGAFTGVIVGTVIVTITLRELVVFIADESLETRINLEQLEKVNAEIKKESDSLKALKECIDTLGKSEDAYLTCLSDFAQE